MTDKPRLDKEAGPCAARAIKNSMLRWRMMWHMPVNTLSYRHHTSPSASAGPTRKENVANPSIYLATRPQQAVGPDVQFDKRCGGCLFRLPSPLLIA